MAASSNQWTTPAVCTALGLLPFVLFLGVSQRTEINGVVSESSFNVGGAVLALIGLFVAARRALLRDIPPVPTPVRAACGTAALICVVGLLHALDVF